MTGRKLSGHPNCELRGSPAASDDETVYRVSVNGVEEPTELGNQHTEVPSPEVEVGQPIDTNGRQLPPGNRWEAPRNKRSWATSTPRFRSRELKSGNRSIRTGGTVIGQPMWRREATGLGNQQTGFRLR